MMQIIINSVMYALTPMSPPVKNKTMEALVVLSPHAGPMMYAATPSEANCVLVFDGTTNKLIEARVKSPTEALKRPSEATEASSLGLGSLYRNKHTGEA